ncbi:DUF3732 domain-containing protein [Archangium violaceum]|uniref:DUF3732 domain-containing protein n=1 Tax=Archangium violaceum TaxID=83451 RepID=UPI002B30FD51|nr:DUF3732 domain-containing protein [Archangium gephyra]
MRLQISTIALYAQDGRTRTLKFRPGHVNVITGKSDTGKSAIIAIVEYCLGRSEFKVPEGIISESVAWYAVVYTLGDTEVLVAKPAPAPGAASQSEVYLSVGPNIELPPMEALRPNSTDDAVVEHFSRAIGIGPNVSTVGAGQSRDPVEATLKHTRFYLFQDQGTVASEHVLFHRQAEPFMAQAIKDTLPYFLGVYDEDRLSMLRELRSSRRELKLAEQRLREEERISAREGGRAWTLLAEAQQAGLIVPEKTYGSEAEVLSALRAALNWYPSQDTEPREGRIEPLRQELRQRRVDYDRLTAQLHAAQVFVTQGDAFSREVSTQAARLSAIGLFGEADETKCPLCHSALSSLPPPVAALNEQLQRLNANLGAVARERPHIEKHLGGLKEERERIRDDIRRLEATIEALVQEDEAAAQVRDANIRAARVVGRLSLYMDAASASETDEALRAQVVQLRGRVQALERQVSTDEDREQLQSTLSWLAGQMSRWAEVLELEFKGQPYRLDLAQLTVVADRNGRPVPLGKRMGGGENWLGCHLIALLALHKFFSLNQRPVPGFLILDQPTQVYFPPDRYRQMEGGSGEVQDEDRIAVQRMYDFLFEVCRELTPNLQIIVLDHANLESEAFQTALVEPPWRGGRALIPLDWKKE